MVLESRKWTSTSLNRNCYQPPAAEEEDFKKLPTNLDDSNVQPLGHLIISVSEPVDVLHFLETYKGKPKIIL